MAEGTGLGDAADTWAHAAFFEEGSSERERETTARSSQDLKLRDAASEN